MMAWWVWVLLMAATYGTYWLIDPIRRHNVAEARREAARAAMHKAMMDRIHGK